MYVVSIYVCMWVYVDLLVGVESVPPCAFARMCDISFMHPQCSVRVLAAREESSLGTKGVRETSCVQACL